MLEKVNAFPMEDLYYLESQDFLVDRESVYLRENKTMKLNSFWIGISQLEVNNDKLLYLFNGLRGYYDVRSRYFKEPKIFEKKVPFSKKNLVNEYFVNKYKYSDMLIYSLNYLNRPTITLKKEEGVMHYSFPSRLVEYINRKRDLINAVEANKEFYKDVRQIKNIGFRFYINPRKKRNRHILNRVKLLDSIAVGIKETFFNQYNLYIQRRTKVLEKTRRIFELKKYFLVRKKKLIKKKLRFFKVPKYIRLLFLVNKRYLRKKLSKIRKKRNFSKNNKGVMKGSKKNKKLKRNKNINS